VYPSEPPVTALRGLVHRRQGNCGASSGPSASGKTTCCTNGPHKLDDHSGTVRSRSRRRNSSQIGSCPRWRRDEIGFVCSQQFFLRKGGPPPPKLPANKKGHFANNVRIVSFTPASTQFERREAGAATPSGPGRSQKAATQRQTQTQASLRPAPARGDRPSPGCRPPSWSPGTRNGQSLIQDDGAGRLRLFEKLPRARGQTIVVITHDQRHSRRASTDDDDARPGQYRLRRVPTKSSPINYDRFFSCHPLVAIEHRP